MHIILAILGIVAGAAFWWWRIKAVGDAANDAADAAGRMWGKYKRKKFLNKVNDSPLAVIDDPATAAVVLMHVVVSEDSKLNHATLKRPEREDLVGMVERVMRAGTPELAPEQRARLDFLRQRLGLQVP